MKLSKKTINKVVSGGLMLGAVVVGGVVPARAASLTSASITLNTSRPNTSQTVAATHTIAFTTGTTMAGGLGCIEAIHSTSPNTFAGGANQPTGLDVTTYSSSASTVTALSIGGNNRLATSGILAPNAYTIKATNTNNASVASGSAVTVTFNNITNPTNTGTYFARVSTYAASDCTGSVVDQIVVSYAIIGGVVVSATVDPSFTFAVSLIAPGNTIKSAITADVGCTGSGTSVVFPIPLSGTKFCGQQLRVNTNAANGYGITLRGIANTGAQPNGFLQSGPTNAIADHSGSNGTPAAWGSPAGSQFGYTVSNIVNGGDLSSSSNRFSADDTYAAVSSTASEIGYNGGPTTNGDTNVGYKITVGGSQAAGTYTGTIIYVATPVF